MGWVGVLVCVVHGCVHPYRYGGWVLTVQPGTLFCGSIHSFNFLFMDAGWLASGDGSVLPGDSWTVNVDAISTVLFLRHGRLDGDVSNQGQQPRAKRGEQADGEDNGITTSKPPTDAVQGRGTGKGGGERN